jgi:hypothetical protein
VQVRVEDRAKEFKSVTIEPTISSNDELSALWHRLDVGGPYLVKRYCGTGKPKVSFPEEWVNKCAGSNAPDCTEELFSALDALAIRRGLRNGGPVCH